MQLPETSWALGIIGRPRWHASPCHDSMVLGSIGRGLTAFTRPSERSAGSSFGELGGGINGGGLNWEGGDCGWTRPPVHGSVGWGLTAVGRRPPLCSRLSGRLLSSSPHLSLSSAASRCFAGAISLLLAHPRRALYVGLGQRFSQFRLRYSELCPTFSLLHAFSLSTSVTRHNSMVHGSMGRG